MSSLFGLYLGNSTASIAIYKEDGRIEIVANDAGDRVTPTTVYVSNKEEVVGLTTANASKLRCSITRNKAFLESDISDEVFLSLTESLPKSVKADRSSGHVIYTITDPDGQIVSIKPTRICTLIFQKLYSIGVSSSGGNEGKLRCVLAVPHHWDTATRKLVRTAASDAGWMVLQLINEPSAVVLSCVPLKTSTCLQCVVYRLGGFSSEATLVKIVNGFVEIVDSCRGTLGARAVVETVAKHLSQDFYRKTRLSTEDSVKCKVKVWLAAEELVRSLSLRTTASHYLESLNEGVDFNANISRARLDALVTPLLPSFSKPIVDVLKRNNVDPHLSVDKVLYCGGGLNIICIKKHVDSLFKSESIHTEGVSFQEVVAMGAAHQAGLVSTMSVPAPTHMSLKISYLSHPITLKFGSGVEDQLILEGTLPCSNQIDFTLPEEGSEFSVSASQGTLNFSEAVIDGFEPSTEITVSAKLSESNPTEILVEAMERSSDEIKSVILRPIEVN